MPSPIAHLTVGYALCRILRKAAEKHPAFRAFRPPCLLLPACLFFSLLPDSDSALGILFGQFGQYHNQWSHSLFFWVLPSCLLAGAVYLLSRDRAVARAWGALCLLSCCMHVLMDYTCQGRGVMLFWPLTTQRFISPVLLFYGVRWSDGVWSLRHIPTILNELLFALVLLPPVIYLTQRPSGKNPR